MDNETTHLIYNKRENLKIPQTNAMQSIDYNFFIGKFKTLIHKRYHIISVRPDYNKNFIRGDMEESNLQNY